MRASAIDANRFCLAASHCVHAHAFEWSLCCRDPVRSLKQCLPADLCARVPSVRSGAQMFWSNGSLDGLVPLNRISLCRSCVFLRKDLCTADPVSPCAEILRASVHVIPLGSFLPTVQRPWPYLVCCDSQPQARGCARSIRWCGGYAEAMSESGAMNRAFSRVPATGRNGVARQNWGSFWHVCVRCKVLIVANIDQTGKRRKVL